MSFWYEGKMIVLILGVIALQHLSSVDAVCQKPTGEEYANTIFNPDLDEYEDSDNVIMDCQTGYSNGGAARSSYCINGNWDPLPLICYSDCQRPGVYDDVTYSPNQDSYEHDSSVTYECVDGMSDVLGAAQSTCQNGVWNPRPTIANPSCSGFRTVPPTTQPKTSATTAGSTTSNQLSTRTDATAESEVTTDFKMTSVSTREETEAVSTIFSSTETPTTVESLAPTDVSTTSNIDIQTTSAFPSTNSATDTRTVSEDMTSVSGQTDRGGTATGATNLTDTVTVSYSTDRTDNGTSTVSEMTDLPESSTFSETTEIFQTEGSNVTIATDQTESGTAMDLTDGTTVSEVTDHTESRTITDSTYQTGRTTMTDSTQITSKSISGTQTLYTTTFGTNQPTEQSSSIRAVTRTSATESPGISTVEYTDKTHYPTTGTPTLESEQPTSKQSSDMTTNTLDTSSTTRQLTISTTQVTNFLKTTSRDQTGITDSLITGVTSTETPSSYQATLTNVLTTGSQGTTSSGFSTRPLRSDPTTSTSQPTEDTVTSRRTEGPTTQASTQAISDTSTNRLKTVSSETPDETTVGPTGDLTSSTEITKSTTKEDLTTVPDIATSAVTELRATSASHTTAAITTMQTTMHTTPPVEDECNGECDETREICVEMSCECQDGFQRPYEGSVCEPTTYYSISITILEIDGVSAVFTDDLRTTGSNGFLVLQSTVCTAVTAVLDGAFAGFKTCSVIEFSAGSIMADIRVGFTNTTGVDVDSILDVVMRSELYQTTNSNFTINTSQTSVIPSDECALGLDDCSPRADCKDLAEKSFTCQCWDGYADYSPDGYDGRNCAAYNWKLITIVVGSCTGALLLAACLLLVCGGNIIERCTKRSNVKARGTRPAPKQDKGLETEDGQDIIPWHHREKDEQIFYAHPVDGQEARRLNIARNLKGNESYDNVESYDLEDYRSSHYDHEERYLPIVL